MAAGPDRKKGAASGEGGSKRRAGVGPTGRGRRAASGDYGAAARVPPQDMEAERATLGAMLLEGEAAGLATEKLVPEDFYRAAHGHIFGAICEVYDEGQQPDELILRERLETKGLLEEVGGSDYLHELATAVPSAANLERYAEIVSERAIARKLINACTASLREAEEGGDISEVLDNVEQRVFDVTGDGASRDIVSIGDLLAEEIEVLERRQQNPGAINGLETNIPELDRLTGGFQRSDFIILAARPSVGKTALALNILDHVSCKLGQPALLFSLEMAKRQVALRMLCTRCRISFEKIRSGFIPTKDWDKIVHVGMGTLGEAPVFVDDTPSIGVMQLRAKARRMKSMRDIKLIIVDYLQLMAGPRAQSREQEVAKTSASLKALARELDIPLLALSQIRRAAEERKDGRPQLADLRESGSLEQDADLVLLLHRDRQEDGTLSDQGSLVVAKHRNGPTGRMDLYFKSEHMRYTAAAMDHGAA